MAASKKKKSGASKKKASAEKASKGSKASPANKEPTQKELAQTVERLRKLNAKLKSEIVSLSKTAKAQKKQIESLEGKMATRMKREDILMTALGLNSRSKKGDAGRLEKLNQSLLTTDDHVLKAGKRIENMLSALKNHREYLIRLNKKVYKIDPMKRIEMELEIMSNTLSIMALSGFNIDKALFGDMKRITKMMEKDDAELAKVQKRMSGFKRKFEEEMEKFDFESIFKKADIPGYR